MAPDIRFLAEKGTNKGYFAENDGEAMVSIGGIGVSQKTALYRPYFSQDVYSPLNPASLFFASPTSGRLGKWPPIANSVILTAESLNCLICCITLC